MDFHFQQRQHRVPKIYLKQFGYLENGIWKIFVVDKVVRSLVTIPIDIFSTAINEFDFPSDNYREKRHFEETAGKIESLYPMVLSSIKNQKKLTLRHEDILRHFAASLIMRSENNRKFFIELLQHPETRDKFLNEVMMSDEETPAIAKLAFIMMNKEEHLPLMQGIITNHLVRILRSFHAVILQDFNGRSWPVSDEPVCIDFQKNYSWILPVEAELYLPLSPDYCLFLFHPKSQLNSNQLRKLKTNKLHLTDEETHDGVFKKIVDFSGGKYLIVNNKYRTDFESFWAEMASNPVSSGN